MNQYDVKVRLEGKPEHVREVARQLRRLWWVLDESRDYPNRTQPGIVRRYLSLVLTFDRSPGGAALSASGLPLVTGTTQAVGQGSPVSLLHPLGGQSATPPRQGSSRAADRAPGGSRPNGVSAFQP